MPFETILNVVWVCVSVAALGLLGSSEYWNRSQRIRPARWRRILSVLFAIIFLFPCVSASDDVLSFQNLQFTLETRGEFGSPLTHRSGDDRPNIHLTRLFETLHHVQLSAPYSLLLTYCVFGLVIPLSRMACERCLLSASGRAPPAAVLAA